jgi:hypothetical protein
MKPDQYKKDFEALQTAIEKLRRQQVVLRKKFLANYFKEGDDVRVSIGGAMIHGVVACVACNAEGTVFYTIKQPPRPGSRGSHVIAQGIHHSEVFPYAQPELAEI